MRRRLPICEKSRFILLSPMTERCPVANSERLPCGGSSSITQADCEASNGYDSSSSTSPFYYANDGEVVDASEQRWLLLDIHACLLWPVTVQCTLDGQFVVVSENMTLPPLDLGSIQLVDSSSPSCSPVTSLSSFVLYQYPVGISPELCCHRHHLADV
ncbi:ZP4 protein, partial [Polypterus senegalus]